MSVRRALRKHLSPLGGDTVTTLNLPPVRMGLLTKLNLLTIGLIFLTAVAVTAFHFTQQWRDETLQVKTQAASMLGIMTELAEYGIYTSDRAYLSQILDSLGADTDVAYVAVLDTKQQVLAERRFAPGLAKSVLPSLPASVTSLRRSPPASRLGSSVPTWRTASATCSDSSCAAGRTRDILFKLGVADRTAAVATAIGEVW